MQSQLCGGGRLDPIVFSANPASTGKEEGFVKTFGPVIPVIFRISGIRLPLFAAIAQLCSPGDLPLESLKIELHNPADEKARSCPR
ncbi:hypothetical protein KUW17_00400 [Leisingera aquaemixtae]|uniref:hypothetical protein n=1 Tax=Leisingera aquaemixtae TaxID=1396826 RepID=UPI001C93CF42|nr:hypothetical protein [Leisingera aquaemixtae]MBY6065187.1 hypothetical protein [Leisingera aquaemixtae]